MKLRILLTTVSLLILGSLFGQKNKKSDQQNLLNGTIKPGLVVPHNHNHDHSFCTLFLSEKVSDYRRHVNLDKARGNAKMGNGTPAVFDVDYEGVPQEAEEAIQFAFDVISTLITTPVPIEVTIDYRELEFGTLAGATYTNISTADGRIYTSSMLNKITGLDIQFAPAAGEEAVDADILITINSFADWHFDPNDASDIGDKTDMSTVMLHEIFHGLGFAGGVVQRRADQEFVLIQSNDGDIFGYDEFIVSGDGTSIKDIAAMGTAELEAAVTGSNLFFSSPNLTEDHKIHVPPTYVPGTSYSHLDELTTLEENALMSPSIARGVVNQDPGVATQMLYDIGWDNTSLIYSPEVFFEEDFNASVVFNPTVFTDSGIDTSSFMLIYSQDTFNNDINQAPVLFNEVSQQWEATLPGVGSESFFQYRMELIQNSRGIKRTTPATFLTLEYFTFGFAIDNIAPEIDHADLLSINSTDTEVEIKAFVSDQFAENTEVLFTEGVIESVVVEYAINDNPIASISADVSEDDFGEFYLSQLPISQTLSSTDVLKYRIIATDKSTAQNSTSYPEDGSFIVVPVNEIGEPADLYTNDFNDLDNMDFGFVDFEIAEVSGFEDGALTNSTHPYPTAGNGRTINFIASLNTPIIIAADEAAAFIKFKEIALVEPAEANSVFGDEDFWDYVIVEAKKLSGGPWEPLLDGYDALDQSAWRFRYLAELNSSTGISSATPIPSMYKDRELSFLGANSPFVANDTVLVRFRLFSDPGAAGWGWMIDNLNIQDANTNVAVEDFIEEENQFLVYPNPSNTGMITVAASFSQAANNLRTELTDIHGRLIRSERITNGSQFYEQEIDISDLPAGIYFMTLRDSESAITKKVVKY